MRFLKAEQIFDGKQFLPNGRLLVLNDKFELEEIISEKDIEVNRVQKLEGILTPGFINGHCHLELSHFLGKIPEGIGLTGFAKYIMQLRPVEREEEILEFALEADKTMFNNGIIAVGDISNKNATFRIKAESKVFYHSFVELIGLHPAFCDAVYAGGLILLEELKQFNLQGSLTPHAPYSVSKELMKKLAEIAALQNLPFSLHNQESNEEILFLEGKKNNFDDLYKFLNLDISWFKPPGISGIRYIEDVLGKAKNLMVHNTFATKEDVALTMSKNIFWCFCPNANLYIENKLPEYELFKNVKNRICIGTDSLASNNQLDLLSEVNVILRHSNVFSHEDLLRAITSQGAELLGVHETFGSFITRKNTGLNLIEIKQNQMRLLKKIS